MGYTPALLMILLATGQHSATSAREIIDDSGVKGGLVVHVGCGNGELTAALRAGDSFLVHGLDTDPQNVAEARQHVRLLGLYGKVSIDTFPGDRLPYVDNLVNLLVAEGPGELPMEEVMRVLAPRGVAMIGGRKMVKPWPDAIDEWTHYLHGPNNNAVAEDQVVGPPRHTQWLAGPDWTRHHHADKGTNPAIHAVVSSRGRLFYMVDEAGTSNRSVPGKWFLAARDAFSGVLLWKRPLGFDFFEPRLELVWRTLVADAERVYAPLGPDQPLSALDAATGAVIANYQATEGFQEVIKHENTLFVVDGKGSILALEADTGRRLWQWSPREQEAIVPLTLAASAGRVFVKTDQGVCCLSAGEGKTLWQVALEGPQKKVRLRFPRERLLVADGVVLCSYGGKDPSVLNRDKWQYLGSHPRVHEYGGKLAALSAEDGSLLWQTDYLPGLESTPGEIYVIGGLVWLGPDFAEPRDLEKGTRFIFPGRKNNPGPFFQIERLWTTGHHYRCYPGKATSRYILTAKRGIEMIDLVGKNHSRNNWVRGTCRVGVSPCNGLLYAPPHSCGCYMEAKLYGFWALAAARTGEDDEYDDYHEEDVDNAEASAAGDERPTADRASQPARLQKGPAYGQSGFVRSEGPRSEQSRADWWTYRADPARSGSTTSPVPMDLQPLWKTDVGGRLSAITVADGKMLIARIDSHEVHALDAERGEALWRFAAGARVDSPPTLYRGLVLFGSRDGWVYCLRASDGEPVWRFLAAPRQLNTVAHEQVESVWPVRGSVLMHRGIAYVAAGRSSYLDGGIVLYGLDPETGKRLCATRLRSEHTGALDPPPEDQRIAMDTTIAQNRTDYKTFLAPDRSDAFSMRGALTDVLVAQHESVFMRHLRFDGDLVQQQESRPHLFSTSSLLDGAEHHRSYWVLGTGDFSRTPVSYPWIVTKSLAVPYGLMLAFDDRTVWGVHRAGAKGRVDRYALFASPRPDPADQESLLPDFAKRSEKKRPAERSWTIGLTMRPRAMIRAGGVLLVGGMAAEVDPSHASAPPVAALAADRGGLLRVVSCGDGQTLREVRLDAPPVWDGMAATGGRVYVATSSGVVTCLGAK